MKSRRWLTTSVNVSHDSSVRTTIYVAQPMVSVRFWRWSFGVWVWGLGIWVCGLGCEMVRDRNRESCSRAVEGFGLLAATWTDKSREMMPSSENTTPGRTTQLDTCAESAQSVVRAKPAISSEQSVLAHGWRTRRRRCRWAPGCSNTPSLHGASASKTTRVFLIPRRRQRDRPCKVQTHNPSLRERSLPACLYACKTDESVAPAVRWRRQKSQEVDF